MDGSLVFVIILVVFALVVVSQGVKTVPQGQNWTVEYFGRYTMTLQPGLALIIPFVQTIGHRISMKETVLDVPGQDVITRDNANIRADGVVFFQVIDAKRAAYEVADLALAITNLAITNLRSVIGAMDLDEVLSNRDSINAKLLTIVDEATNPWGVKVTRIEIKDLEPPRDITEAMARQMKAERERRAQILEAEGEKQAAILRSEGMKQGAILEAEGRREAAFRDAEAREREAEAEAKATQMVSDAIASGDVNAVNYFVAQRYVHALEVLAAAPNQRVILMPLEASGILGSIAGVAELAKSAFDPGGDGPHGGGPAGPSKGPKDKGDTAPPRRGSTPTLTTVPGSGGDSTAQSDQGPAGIADLARWSPWSTPQS